MWAGFSVFADSQFKRLVERSSGVDFPSYVYRGIFLETGNKVTKRRKLFSLSGLERYTPR
jgi:hypothetical protein